MEFHNVAHSTFPTKDVKTDTESQDKSSKKEAPESSPSPALFPTHMLLSVPVQDEESDIALSLQKKHNKKQASPPLQSKPEVCTDRVPWLVDWAEHSCGTLICAILVTSELYI